MILLQTVTTAAVYQHKNAHHQSINIVLRMKQNIDKTKNEKKRRTTNTAAAWNIRMYVCMYCE